MEYIVYFNLFLVFFSVFAIFGTIRKYKIFGLTCFIFWTISFLSNLLAVILNWDKIF